MKIIWLGHGSFRIETADLVLLLDPWLTGNPMLTEHQHDAAVSGATHIILTHVHFDHVVDVLPLARRLNIPVVGQYDIMGLWGETEGIETIGFNKGGTVDLDGAKLSMVTAQHSSTFSTEDGLRTGGSEVGYMLAAEGHTVYLSGDTDIMADMEWFGDYYKPDIGILSAGGHFTMDMAKVAYAAKRYFAFKTLIPAHYRTFPILEQSAQTLAAALPGVDVIEPQVLQAIEI
ncbi:metal-dependent hydrolase [Sedimentitalea nanhaiensis]|uniref:L-ascorbate metabolism protein UlaG, beta-lactamase superfamily n=1 Tax=Sedimentitalea nanhaiensis TaxID=999627 RepID=A0A1I6Y6N2_9RHOB|nr:metal-dependent hydrolase [Sedimentitalea nanhaiensis]SFT46082.1 L-ascorbate metabolism protein UlaG, beta-lactamase superfamily [Sedimentitalea nanhaiensis]